MRQTDRHVAREISYATAMKSRGAKLLVRTMENATGRLGLIKKAKGYQDDVASGRDFWQVMADRFGLRLDVTSGSLENIPETGPLVVVANHPYGILDGLMMGLIMSQRRQGDFKVMAHQVFRRAPDIERVILPVSFDETKEAARANLQTRAQAVKYLNEGGAVGIFPGGTVSTAARPFDMPLDPTWRNFTAKMVTKAQPQVVPIYFEGTNSRLFQIASHMHYNIRMGLLIREFKSRVGTPVHVRIGEPIAQDELANYRHDAKAMMDFLRKRTYELGNAPAIAQRLGKEFEAKYKVQHGSRDI